MADGSQNNQPRRDKGPDDRFEWKRAARTISFWIVLILAVIIITTYFGPKQDQPDTIDFDKYRALLQNGSIESAEVIEREFIGTIRSEITDPTQMQQQVRVVLPYVTETMVDEWQSLGIQLEFKEKATNWLGYILTSILPWVILIGFWIFLLRRMQGGGTRGIFSFGKSRAKLLIDNKPKVTFDDVAGSDEAKEELQEVVHFLKAPKKFQKLGGRIPRGALLVGPPGTGKTLLGRAIAGEAGVPFFSMSGADFVEMFVGVGASRVRDLFEQGKKHAPCIIFIDEIDAVGRQRGAGLGGGHDEREQTLNQLLVEMDGFESNEGVILIAATNRPDVLDPALLRPGRFDRQIVVDRPDVRGREGVLRVHTKNIPLAKDVNLKTLSKGTPGLSGADLANLANEAALLAARRDASKVYMRDFEDAKDKVMMGAERKSMLISDEEKKLTAYHEAGHVLVALFTPGSDPVHKVTIIPRGRALGVTHYLPIDEKHSWAKKYIEGKLIHLLGGRAAERIVFDDYTNGAASDIKQATGIARKMVCDWGMSEKIGPLSLGTKDQEIFIGREMTTSRDYSEATALEIDREVKRIVLTGQNKAEKILKDKIDKLHALAKALLDREILDGEEITMVVEGKKLPPIGKKKGSGRRSRKRPARRPSSKKNYKKQPDNRLDKVDEVLAELDKKDSSKDSGKNKNSATKSDPKSDKPVSNENKSSDGQRRRPIRRGGPAARPGSKPRTSRPNVGRGTRSSSRPPVGPKKRTSRPPVNRKPGDNKEKDE